MTSTLSQKVGIAAATLKESQRVYSFWWRPGSPDSRPPLLASATDVRKINSREELEKTLKESLRQLNELTFNPSNNHTLKEVQVPLDNRISWLLSIARHPLATQEDLGKMRSAGVLALLYREYIQKEDCPLHLFVRAKELAKILSTPPKVSDPHHYLSRTLDPLRKTKNPSLLITFAENIFYSSDDLATRQKAAQIYKTALEAKRKHTCALLKESLKKEPSDEQQKIVQKLQAIVEALRQAPDPENPDECIRFRPHSVLKFFRQSPFPK